MMWVTIIGFSAFSMLLISLPFWLKLRDATKHSSTTNPQQLLLIITVAISLPLLAYGIHHYMDGMPGNIASQTSSQDTPATDNVHIGDMQQMILRLEKKLDLNPNDKEGWDLLARSYLYIKDYKRALSALQKLANISPDEAGLKLKIAETTSLLNQKPLAGATVQKIMQGPDGQMVNVGAMVERLRTKLEKDPGNYDGWIMLGRSYKNLGQLEDSLNAYQQADSLKPYDQDVTQIIKELSSALAKKHITAPLNEPVKNTPIVTERKEPITLLEENFNEDPDNIGNGMLLARDYMKLNNFDQAVITLEKLLAMSPNDIHIIIPLADALAMSNAGSFNARARELIKQALAIEPNHPIALWLAGMVEQENEDYDAALVHWKKLIVLLKEGSPDSIELQSMIERAEQALK